jgi:hypothetical protein
MNPRPFSASGRAPTRPHRSRRRPRLAGALRGAWLALVAAFPLRAEVLLERTFLPHGAAPSSFAVGLPGGPNFCFDPVRAAVTFVWTGGFLDLAPARPGPGKFVAPARPLGPLVYQETGDAPLRRRDPARLPAILFTGYTLRDDAVEFRYTVDGLPVREEIRANPARTALLRRFHFPAGTDATWWHAPAGRPPVELRREPSGTFLLELPLAAATP